MKANMVSLQAVEQIVRDASRLMRATHFEVMQKGGCTNLVTSADIAVQQYLCSHLQPLLPHADLICEEGDFQATSSSLVWVIDPIDGTANFARGHHDCAISVALVSGASPVLAVVYAPFSDLLYTAEAGKGARCNGRPMAVSHRTLSEALVCGGFSLYDKSLSPLCWQVFGQLFHSCNDFRCIGSAALGLSALAAGQYDMFFEIRLSPWDYAAAQLLITEAGGIVTTLQGAPLTYDKPQAVIAANNGENHRLLLSTIHNFSDR